MITDSRTPLQPLPCAAAIAVAVVTGCSSGPVALDAAVLPDERSDYTARIDAHDGNGAAAYLAWRSAETGTPVAELARADAELSRTENPFDAGDPWVVQRGALLYEMHCIDCHGANADGRGPEGEPLMGIKDFHHSHIRMAAAMSDDYVAGWFAKIADGSVTDRPMPDGTMAAMPPMADLLTREQIWLTIAYLRSDERIAGALTP